MAEEEFGEECFSTLKFPFLAVASPTSGTATPPLQSLAASVPFKWEELPGKPRPCTDIVVRPQSIKTLELPPSASASHRITSPTTVLDGPYNMGRPKFSSFRKAHGSFDSISSAGSPHSSSVDVLLPNNNNNKKTTTSFAKLITRRRGSTAGKQQLLDGGSFGFSPFSVADTTLEKSSKGRKQQQQQLRRNASFSTLSRPPSTHLWVTVRESLKRAIPWTSSRKSNNEGACLKECNM